MGDPADPRPRWDPWRHPARTRRWKACCGRCLPTARASPAAVWTTRARREACSCRPRSCWTFGLVADVWTNDVRRAHRTANGPRAGTVWIDAYRVVAYNAPFGGFGQSGLGRENGRAAVDEYLETKTVLIKLSGPRATRSRSAEAWKSGLLRSARPSRSRGRCRASPYPAPARSSTRHYLSST